MRIGIIGTGRIGGTLGSVWARAGHEVLFSYSTDENKLRRLAEQAGPLGRWGSVPDAVGFGDVTVLSVPWQRAADVFEQLADWGAGTVLDTMNAYGHTPQGFADPASGPSIAAQVQERVRPARVVKVFNTLYFELLTSAADRAGGKIAIPVSGDDPAAKAIAAGLVEDAGFAPVDLGGLDMSVRQEPGSPIYNQQYSVEQIRAVLAEESSQS